MKKYSFFFALLVAATGSVSATNTGNNNANESTKQTKQLLKFSAREFTGTEDAAAEMIEIIPADTIEAKEKVTPLTQPADNSLQKKAE